MLNRSVSRLFLLILFVFAVTNSTMAENYKRADDSCYYLIFENDIQTEAVCFEFQDFNEKLSLEPIHFNFSNVLIQKSLFNFLYYKLLLISNFVLDNPFFLDIPPPAVS